MPRRLAALLLLLCLAIPARAEATPEDWAELPDYLPQADALEEAEIFIQYPPDDETDVVTPGFIRLITQHRANDEAFRDAYWQGGEAGGEMDLTLKKSAAGQPYAFHAGTMCTRAAYSMALSYLGIDVTPGDMSAMTGRRDLNPPYQEVSQQVGVELVSPGGYVFDTLVGNYLADPRYSPVYVYLLKPDGQEHALLIIGKMPEKSCYIVLDPAGVWLRGQQHRVYMLAFNQTRTEVVNSTFRQEYAGSQVLQLHQWRLPEEAAPLAKDTAACP